MQVRIKCSHAIDAPHLLWAQELVFIVNVTISTRDGDISVGSKWTKNTLTVADWSQMGASNIGKARDEAQRILEEARREAEIAKQQAKDEISAANRRASSEIDEAKQRAHAESEAVKRQANAEIEAARALKHRADEEVAALKAAAQSEIESAKQNAAMGADELRGQLDRAHADMQVNDGS
jgi:F0F1-type ATP synthase membrane subunit b/b'